MIYLKEAEFTGITLAQLKNLFKDKMGMTLNPDGSLFSKTVNSQLFVCIVPGHMIVATGRGSVSAAHPILSKPENKTLIQSADVLFVPVSHYQFGVHQIMSKKSQKWRSVMVRKLFAGKLVRAKNGWNHDFGALLIVENRTRRNFLCCCKHKVARMLKRACSWSIPREISKLLAVEKNGKSFVLRTTKTPAERALSWAIEKNKIKYCISNGCVLPLLYLIEMTMEGHHDIQPYTNQMAVINYFRAVWSSMKGIKMEPASAPEVAVFTSANSSDVQNTMVGMGDGDVKREGDMEEEMSVNEDLLSDSDPNVIITKNEQEDEEEDDDSEAVVKVEEIMSIPESETGDDDANISVTYSLYREKYL